jgi:hypothetical protein
MGDNEWREASERTHYPSSAACAQLESDSGLSMSPNSTNQLKSGCVAANLFVGGVAPSPSFF